MRRDRRDAGRDPGEDQLHQVSAALDGEGPMPEELGGEAASFLAAASRLRSALRVEEAEVPPDVTADVLVRVRSEARRSAAGRWRRSNLLAAAAVFVVAALVAAWAVRPGGPIGPEPALADVGAQVLRAQRSVTALDAEVSLVERGAHREAPVRRYGGTLRYQAPERLWLRLDERSAPAPGWPPNDLELVVHDGAAWSSGLHDCPVVDQPTCLGAPETRAVRGLPPFAADWISPLDLVVPVDAFLPEVDTVSTTAGDTVAVDTTVARLHRLIDGLRAAGALRPVHATDHVRLELDREAFTLRRLSVTPSRAPARALWAATNGYHDAPGVPVLELVVTPASLPDATFPAVPAASRDAGFTDGTELDAPLPGWLPEGFSAHRAGILANAGPRTLVRSWSNGRAWIRLDATTEWDGDELFGGLGPLVRPLQLGDGIGYTDPGGSVLAVHAAGVDLTLTGSVPLGALQRVAASIDVEGEPVPQGWPQGEALVALPKGALQPPGPLTARYDHADLLVAVPGPGDTGALLRQRPGTELGPPPKADVVETAVRGRTGRYAPRLGTLTWVEHGWVRELRAPGLDLDGLLAIAAELVEP